MVPLSGAVSVAGDGTSGFGNKLRSPQLGMWVRPAMAFDGSELSGRLVAHGSLAQPPLTFMKRNTWTSPPLENSWRNGLRCNAA